MILVKWIQIFWNWIKKQVLKHKIEKDGVVMNPIFQMLPRNATCICGSEKKVKNCCGQYRKIPKKQASDLILWFSTVPVQFAKNTGVKESYWKYFKQSTHENNFV